MRAVALDRHSDASGLTLRELPEPKPGPDDLLIEVHACGLNPVDTKIRADGLRVPRTFPLILGYDVSGVVRGVGEQVQGFQVGDEVYASPSLVRNGANAELVCVDWRSCAPKPQALSHLEAAALPLVTLTAWEALHDRARMHPSEDVLIHAGGGGVGHVAIQLAKLHGNRVLTTASSPASIALCHELGADVVINYREEDFVRRVEQETGGKGCPVVFDTVGPAIFARCLDCVAVCGRIVTILPTAGAPLAEKLFIKNASVHFEFMGAPAIFGVNLASQGQILQTVGELADAGRFRPHIQQVFDLEELPQAHLLQESGHVTGKIVIRVK